MAVGAPVTVVRNPHIIADPFGAEPLNFPPTSITASTTARVWTAVEYTAMGSLVGAMVGTIFVKFLASKNSSEEQEESAQRLFNPGTWIGAAVGCCAGACYSLFRDHYVHFQLRTDWVGTPSAGRQVALQKANTIFKTYASKKCGHAENELCDKLFSYNLYIYPVKAGDGQIYEHAEIHRFITENYPAALDAYQLRTRQFPNDTTIQPPSPSPVASGNVQLNELRLHLPTMKKISNAMVTLFKDLRCWNHPLQSQINASYQQERFSVFSTPSTALTEEAIRNVNEQALADKLCTGQPLLLEEVFVIKQLFDPYLVEIRERDNRIFKAISLALASQLHQNIINADRFTEEMQSLAEWYAYTKELYHDSAH
jgi:hypothetical protein